MFVFTQENNICNYLPFSQSLGYTSFLFSELLRMHRYFLFFFSCRASSSTDKLLLVVYFSFSSAFLCLNQVDFISISSLRPSSCPLALQVFLHEIKPVTPKGNQPWTLIGRTDAKAEALILWLPDAKSWLIGKDLDAGKGWRQEEKGMTEDERAG